MRKFMRLGAIPILCLWCSVMTAQINFNYGEALQKSLFFYEAQQSGKLPSWNRVSWRGDSALDDGSDVGLDLTGGWYDAGDHVKFGFPMAFSVTALAWGGIEYEDAYRKSGQLAILKRNLRFVTDYFMKCHPKPNVLYGQLGAGGPDHAYWGSPEVMPMPRPAYKIDEANPGTELAAETAAAMAAVSILFKNDDPSYSATLLNHAKQLYNFADKFRGTYSESIADAAAFYRSFNGYQDELAWGAAWMYRATNDAAYLAKAEQAYATMGNEGQSTDKAYKFAFSWDDKGYGTYVLMAQLTGKSQYKKDAERHLDFWTSGVAGDKVTYSPGGQAHLIQWGSLRYAANTSLLALIYSDKVNTTAVNKKKYHDFAVGQVRYALGDNPINRSFMVGFGNNPANAPHHRSSHGAWANSLRARPNAQTHVLYGALVGGPSSPNDQFVDDRGDFIANEVACDYNACFTGVLARMYDEFGGSTLSNFPENIQPTRAEVRTVAKFNSNNSSGSTIQIRVQNRTAWPARVTDKLSYRYFFDISEGVAQGLTIADYQPRLNAVQGNSTVTIGTWDAAKNIYYAEVSLAGEQISPIGDPQFRRETQLNFRVANGVPYDTTNDWSAKTLSGAEGESTTIPVYDNGVLVFGEEPDGGNTPTASFTATPESGLAPLEVIFDASTSSDPNGDSITYSWDFGNGETSTALKPGVTYTSPGTYTVVLVVSDGTNTSSEVTKTIEVTDGNIAPVAAFTATPDTGIAPVTVNFDASDSFDENQDALTYSWDFGDGTLGTGITASHEYTTVGNYTVVLAVNDGKKEDSVSKTITVTNGAPIASFAISTETGVVPFAVDFDASDSVDPTAGTLAYNWDFGNGQTSTGVKAVANFDTVGTYTVTLTVTNSIGSSMLAKTITATDGTSSCDFDTPIAEPLPTLGNQKYDYIFVLGEGGPDLSNVTNFTINWDLANNGLYQLSMNTNNGIPKWWNDLLGKSTQDFNQAKPSISFTSTGFAGLDGAYWVNLDGDNLVLVSKTAGFTIYFSKTNTQPNCDGGTTNPDPIVAGGIITGGPFEFIVGNRTADNVFGITLTGNVGKNSTWVVTDESAKILGLYQTLAALEKVNFDGAAEGVCLIWHLSHEDDLQNAAIGNNASALSGTFDLSNAIKIIRKAEITDPGTGTGAGADCKLDTPTAAALPSINSQFSKAYVLGTTGPDLSNITKFTINWSLENNGLYELSANTNNGNPNWYIDLRRGISQSFNAAKPEVTFTGVGIVNFDGSYWVTIDKGNFALVSKDRNFTIYFSNGPQAPDCEGTGGGDPTNTAPVAVISPVATSGVAPYRVNFDASKSSDADGDALAYAWDFGDGNMATGVAAAHTFTAKGSYVVTLTVTDAKDATATDTVTITVTEDVIITPPSNDNAYINRFIEMRNEFYDPANGYFSKDGSPHHSIESLIVEAPDHGHESTSELYSYWLWLEVMHGRITGDWKPLRDVWEKIEKFIIPSKADQPTNAAYKPASPAAYAPEFALPDNYPAPLNFSAPVGQDPVSSELTAAYGPEVYQMHWLLDNDNFYGYGNRGDGVSTPSYINTFQRGEQESVYETIPHPAWEGFDWGGTNGFLPLFVKDRSYAKQWRYTSAPDADARVVQAMYWAMEYAKEQGIGTASLDLDKTIKMGDYLRLAMFDKYFKPLGVQSETSGAGSGYNSAHYLMSWYISWGGAANVSAPWAFRISSSHCHFGYQNPVAAYALSQIDALKPKTRNGARDWGKSLQRQLEFYTWLQSEDGGIAGGATNSWNGNYSKYPAGKSTFYDMAFDKDPVYHDPGSGTWFGWQAWSMERIAEYYYITNNTMAKNLMDKWVAWVKREVKLVGDNDFDIPATLEWTGEPDTWNPNNPGTNSNLRVKVVNYGKDLGIAASTAKTLIYYAAATQKHATLDTGAKKLAKEILDRMWVSYRDDKGVAALEARGDFKRMFEQEVYVPNGFSGTMANGDPIQPGVSFLDIRSNYKNDPEYARLKKAYDSGNDYTQKYHRSWAQIEVALANADYGYFFGDDANPKSPEVKKETKVTVSPNPASNFVNISLSAKAVSQAKSANTAAITTQIRILDLKGNVVRTKSIRDSQATQARMDVAGLPSSVYMVEVIHFATKETSRTKVVIK